MCYHRKGDVNKNRQSLLQDVAKRREIPLVASARDTALGAQ